jgi:electron transport complex protein RnfG
MNENMKQYIKMIVVLTLIATVCGFLLSAVKQFTAQRIEEQILVNVKLPAVKKVLEPSTNDLVQDRRSINVEDQEHVVFTGKKDGKAWAVAFESSGSGFGGDIGVMVGFDLEKDQLTGIGILTHQETPGLGARITEPAFTGQFKGKSLTAVFKVKKDNGEVDAVSGATNSSRGVCTAVEKCIALYPAVKAKAAENK